MGTAKLEGERKFKKIAFNLIKLSRKAVVNSNNNYVTPVRRIGSVQ